jgi:tetratricopeptide (TPR) repeat protein
VREELGDRAGAKEAYEKAVRADADGAASQWNLALLLERDGQTAEAEKIYGQLAERHKDEDEPRFRLGCLRLQRDDFTGAVEAFEVCLNRRPDWKDAQANLALACAKAGDHARAQRIYDEMLESDPKSVAALRGLAGLALDGSDFETALEQHVRLIDLGDRSAEILYNTGLMYQKTRQFEKAAAMYREAISRQPDMPEALLNLGHVLDCVGQPEEARAYWAKALAAKPALAQDYFGGGTE